MTVSKPWAVLTVLLIAETVSGFESSMMLAGLGAWMREFRDPIGVGWIVSSFILVQAAAAALLAPLGDIFGRKRLLLAAIAGAAIGSLISAFAPSLGWIIAGRAMQGAAGAILPLCIGLSREHLPAARVPFAVGVLAAAAAISAAAGFMIGGVITDGPGPQYMFFASAAAATAAFIVCALLLPGSQGGARPEKLDIVGGVLVVPAVTGLLLVMSKLSAWPWPMSAGLALGCILLLAAWWNHEKRHPSPLIDVKLFARREILLANLVMAGCAVGAMGLTQVSSILLQQNPATGVGFGLSATVVGMLKLPMLVAGSLSAVWAGWACGRWGAATPMVAGSAGVVLGLGLAVVDHDAVWLVILAVVVANAGTTALFAGVPNAIVAASPSGRTSEVTGLSAVVRALCQAIGAQTIAVILASSTVAASAGHKGQPSGSAFTLVFAFMAVAGLLSLFSALALRRRSVSTPGRRPAAAPAPVS